MPVNAPSTIGPTIVRLDEAVPNAAGQQDVQQQDSAVDSGSSNVLTSTPHMPGLDGAVMTTQIAHATQAFEQMRAQMQTQAQPQAAQGQSAAQAEQPQQTDGGVLALGKDVAQTPPHSGVLLDGHLPLGPVLPAAPDPAPGPIPPSSQYPGNNPTPEPGTSPTDPFGNPTPTSPALPGLGLGAPVPGTTPVYPAPPPWPAPDHPLNEGYDTQAPSPQNYAFAGVLFRCAQAVETIWPDAANNLIHFLGGSGTDQQLNVESMLNDPSFSGTVSQGREGLADLAIANAQAAGATGPLTFPVNSTWEDYHFDQQTDPNWFFATGDIRYSQQGFVTVYPPDSSNPNWHAIVSTQVSVCDYYNWDSGKSTQFPPGGIDISDASLSDLMKAGIAKEFIMYGSSPYSIEHY